MSCVTCFCKSVCLWLRGLLEVQVDASCVSHGFSPAEKLTAHLERATSIKPLRSRHHRHRPPTSIALLSQLTSTICLFLFSGGSHPRLCRPHATTMSSRASLDALEAAAVRRRAVAAGPQADAPPPAEVEPSSEPSGDAEPIAAPAEPNEPRADSPATAEVEPRADGEPNAAPVEAAEPRVEAPAPAEAEPSTEAPPPGKAEPRAEDTFDWNATPGPAKYAAFMEAFPADKYGGPAYVPAYPRKTK